MNKQQRIKNRNNARKLLDVWKSKQICPNCGLPGPHWIHIPTSIEAIMITGNTDPGFWTCPKLYGEDGRRLEGV